MEPDNEGSVGSGGSGDERSWAPISVVIVDRLATEYGWSRRDILTLPYVVAVQHMAFIREREEGAAKAEADSRPKPRSPRESLMQNLIARRRQEH